MPGRPCPVPDSQIGLTMAVPIDVATWPRDPEPALAAPGQAIEERLPVQTGGQRARASVGDTPSHRTQLQLEFTAGWGEIRIALRSRAAILIR